MTENYYDISYVFATEDIIFSENIGDMVTYNKGLPDSNYTMYGVVAVQYNRNTVPIRDAARLIATDIAMPHLERHIREGDPEAPTFVKYAIYVDGHYEWARQLDFGGAFTTVVKPAVVADNTGKTMRDAITGRSLADVLKTQAAEGVPV